MSNTLIRRGFETVLKAWADAQAPALPIAWENVTFAPPATTYLRSFLLPATTDSLDLQGLHREFRGVYQVSIVLPIGGGQGAGELLVSALDALFPLTAPLIVAGLSVYVTRPMSAGPLIQEPDRAVIPCSLGYQAHTV